MEPVLTCRVTMVEPGEEDGWLRISPDFSRDQALAAVGENTGLFVRGCRYVHRLPLQERGGMRSGPLTRPCVCDTAREDDLGPTATVLSVPCGSSAWMTTGIESRKASGGTDIRHVSFAGAKGAPREMQVAYHTCAFAAINYVAGMRAGGKRPFRLGSGG